MSMKYLGETFDLHCGGDRPHLPAPRERDRAERVRHGQAVRAALDARRAPARRERDDVEEQGQLLHDPRPAGAGPPARRDPLPALAGPLPQAAQLHLGGAAATRAAALERVTASCSALGEVERRGPGRAARSRRPARRRGRPSTPRSATTSTPRRRWPPCTAWSATANALLAAGEMTREGAAPGARRSIERDGRGLRRAAARGGEDRLSRRGAGAVRRASGGAAQGASSRARTRRARRLEALGVVLEDTPEGHAVAPKALTGLHRAHPRPARGPEGEDLACRHLEPPRASRSWPATTAAARARWTWSRATATSPCSSR